ncbi:WD repeat protein [Histomonas meleagridis]|uniref:WD repeat protein n=1 Tax=Histomonas meleagridis TaxID=135588 RepID=UPI00355A650E|nr:WD repeat protein [Histomonas meleagridis]
MSGSSLDFVFSNLISGTYSGATICFDQSGEKLLLPEGNRLSIFDVSRSQVQTQRLEHRSTITHVAVSKCGNYVITADRKNYVIISNFSNNGFHYQRRFKKPITALAFAPNKKGFAVASSNKLTIYKDPSEVTALKPFVHEKSVGGHYDSINHIDFSPDGSLFVTCSSDMTIRLFMTDPVEDFVPITLAGHRGKPIFATFIEDNKTIMSLGQDGSVFVWSISDDFTVQIVSKRRLDEENFDSPKNKFQNIVAASYKNGFLVCGFTDGSFKVYSVPNQQTNLKSSASVTFSNERVSSIAVSDKYAAITSGKLGELIVWDLQNGSVAQRTLSHFGGVKCFAYSPNGVVVATGGDDGKLKIWDTQTGCCLSTFDEHKGPINDIAFGESGRTVVTASFDGTCKAFDVVRGRCFRTFSIENNHVEFSRVAIDSHCEFVAACGRGGMEIYLWAMTTGKLLETLTGHSGPVSSVAFTQMMRLVSGSWDGTVRIWDFLDSHSSVGLEARGEVTDIAISPDGNTLCIANSLGRLIMYNPDTNEYVGEIEISNDARGGKLYDEEISAKSTKWYFDSIDFSPDSSYIICGGRSKFLCIYNVKRKLLMRRIQYTVNEEYSGVDGYIKKYHGSGVAQQILDAKLGQREVITASIFDAKWCPTGRGFGVATPEGLLIYVSSDQIIVDPIELETDITPLHVKEALEQKEYVKAIIMGIRLGHTERQLLFSTLTNIPVEGIDFVVSHIPSKYAADFLQFLAEALKNPQVELVLRWIKSMLVFHTHKIMKDKTAVPAAHLLQKSLSFRVDQVMNTARANLDLMNFLCGQPDPVPELEAEE